MNPPQTYVMMRLNRCAIWLHSGAFPGPRPVRSWWGPMVLDRNVEQLADPTRPQRVEDSEADETYRCVLVLVEPLRSAVCEAYFKGGTVEQKARYLGCCIQTYYNRLDRAHVELLGLFNDVAAGIQLPSRPKAVEKKRLPKLECFSNLAATMA